MEQMNIFDFLEKPKISLAPTKLIVVPKEIQIVSVEAYTFIRKCDNRKMTAFLCECENGMLYRKDFYTYHHMVENTKKNREAFYREIEKYKDCIDFKRETDFVPAILEMHKCKETVDWKYAEAGYSGCEDAPAYEFHAS